MTNSERGDACLEIEGARHCLRFSLAALAEIESRLGAPDATRLGERFKTLSAADLQAVLTALLRAGGAEAPEQLAAEARPRAAARAVAACLKANLS